MHAQKLLADGEVSDPKALFGAWALHFQNVDRAFADDPEWRKVMVKPRELAARHDKLVDKAKKGLDKNSKETRAAGLRAVADGFLSARLEELRRELDKAFVDARPPEPEGKQQLETLAATRATAKAEADKAIAAILQPLLEELMTAAPPLFATEPAGAVGK